MNPEAFSIMSLNDYCLINIFEHLEFNEKFQVELVCKRWNELAKKSWNHVNKLDLHPCKLPYLTDIVEDYKIKNRKYLLAVIDRCGVFLKKISIFYKFTSDIDNYPMVQEKLLQYSNNITHLKLNNVPASDKYIKSFFSKCINLTSITIFKSSIQGNFLSEFIRNVHGENIKELNLKDCIFRTENNSYNFFIQFKNLNRISIAFEQTYMQLPIIHTALNALIQNELDIHEFSLSSIVRSSVDNLLTTLFTNQTNLRKLELKNDFYSPSLINNVIPVNKLEELHLDVLNETFPYIISRFEKLHTFSCSLQELSDKFFMKLSDCLNLKHLNIHFHSYLQPDKDVNYLENFKNLESFSIKCRYLHVRDKENIDKLLEGLSNFKCLKKLGIDACNFTYLGGLQKLSSLPTLNILEITESKIRPREIDDFISKSVNLKEVKLISCNNVNNSSAFAVANLMKTAHNKTPKLNIKIL